MIKNLDNGQLIKEALHLDLLGNHQEAIYKLEQAINLNQDSKEAYMLKGTILQKQDKHDEAIDCFEKILDIDNNNIKACFLKIQSLRKQKKFEQVLEVQKQLNQISDRIVLAKSKKQNSNNNSFSKCEKKISYQHSQTENDQNNLSHNNKSNQINNNQPNPVQPDYYTLQFGIINKEQFHLNNQSIQNEQINKNQGEYNQIKSNNNDNSQYTNQQLKNMTHNHSPNYNNNIYHENQQNNNTIDEINLNDNNNQDNSNSHQKYQQELLNSKNYDQQSIKAQQPMTTDEYNKNDQCQAQNEYQNIEEEEQQILLDNIIEQQIQIKSRIREIGNDQEESKQFEQVTNLFSSQVIEKLNQQDQSKHTQKIGSKEKIIYQEKSRKDLKKLNKISKFYAQMEEETYQQEMSPIALIKKLTSDVENMQQQILIKDQKYSQMEQDFKDSGIAENLQLKRDIKELSESEDQSYYYYYKSFYWTSISIFRIYQNNSFGFTQGKDMFNPNQFGQNKQGNKQKLQYGFESDTNLFQQIKEQNPILKQIFTVIDQFANQFVCNNEVENGMQKDLKNGKKNNSMIQILIKLFESEDDLQKKIAQTAIILINKKKQHIQQSNPNNIFNQKPQIIQELQNYLDLDMYSEKGKSEQNQKNKLAIQTSLQDVGFLMSQLQTRIQILQSKVTIDNNYEQSHFKKLNT
ncbi:hypothetical protein ABPG74_011125 [Tetrahymena malaccensis]